MRVLVARLSAMGDVVHGIAAVMALRAQRPELEVFWVVQRESIPLLEHAPLGLAGIVPFDRRGGPLAYLRCMREVRHLRVDVALDLQGNWKSAGLCRASGARRRLGVTPSLRREPRSSILLGDFVAPPKSSRHPADAALALVSVLAPAARLSPPPWLSVGEDVLSAEAASVAALGVDPEAPMWAIVLGNPADPRSLRARALIEHGRKQRIPILGLQGPGDGEVPSDLGIPILLHRRGELPRLIALGALIARRGGLVIGPDKGATHVLVASGARAAIVHGPTDPAKTFARGGTLVQTAAPPPCMPCDRRVCRHSDGPVCMDLDESTLTQLGRGGFPTLR